jgi:limonene 1,2-monooxygenase
MRALWNVLPGREKQGAMAIKLRSGIFIPPFHPLDEDPTLCFQRDLELVEHLDRLGYEEAWFGEHHTGGYEIIHSPELFIAAAAERTKRIRLGTGVVSLPYHNPLMVANRILQLDHMTRGRLMFGVGPGLLASDAIQMGIDPNTQRDRMVEALEVILRLFAGERVTRKTEWFDLVDAHCQLQPYTWPHPEIAIASAVTPSGGKLAGKYGFAMMCMAATQQGAFDALPVNWKIANEVAAQSGHTMDAAALRLLGPVHIAETREQAMANVRFGFEKWAKYFIKVSPAGPKAENVSGDPVEHLVKEGVIVVGTPDDAIAQIRRLHDKQGEFGCFLQLCHHWADFENTKKSYEMWQRYVMPVINRLNTNREVAFDYITSDENAARFLNAAATAAARTIEKHQADEGRK